MSQSTVSSTEVEVEHDEEIIQTRAEEDEAYQHYELTMLAYTQHLLSKAERVARLRAQLANEPHNACTIPIVPTPSKTCYAGQRATLRDFNEKNRCTSVKLDTRPIEKAIASLSLRTPGFSKIASIKTPVNPSAASKKKVLNKHGLRLTLDDRRPTI